MWCFRCVRPPRVSLHQLPEPAYPSRVQAEVRQSILTEYSVAVASSLALSPDVHMAPASCRDQWPTYQPFRWEDY
jgi:hypothetical protein